jgi:hypothetical protein
VAGHVRPGNVIGWWALYLMGCFWIVFTDMI